jgi:colicin import membrane protein
MKSGDYIFSMMFHGLIVAVLLLFTFTLQHRAVETPKIFELVAGEGDNYAATEAPALGTPGGVKLAAAPLPAPTPPAPAPVETPLTAATPPPAPKAPNFVKDVTRIAKKREARLEAKYKAEEEKAAKEEAANGLVAQLEERRNGIAEVVSSNLIGSTNFWEQCTAHSYSDRHTRTCVTN